jgi:hypothetical protein
MEFLDIIILVAAGFIGGVITALLGGASLVTFPAFLAVGLTPVHAIASNLTVLMPANLLAAYDDRGQLPRFDGALAWLVVASLIGAGLGSVLLLMTPARVFSVLVPLLLGLATVLFAYSEKISGWLRVRAERDSAGGHAGHSVAALVPVSIYGGYFGAGVGVLLVGVLSVGAKGDYRVANALKNLVNGLNCIVTTIILSGQGAIAWPQTLVMITGSLAGGILGGRLGRVLPRETMRLVIVAAGVLLTAIYAQRYWF